MAGAEPGAAGASAADGASIEVVVAWSPGPRRVEQLRLALPAGSDVAAALRACAATLQASGLDLSALQPAVWGRRVAAGQVLQAGDRLELCRGLQVDPKEARRLRYKGHRAQGLTRGRQTGGAARQAR